MCVHRKGATRAFGPGNAEVPADYRDVGQPVLIPGDMGTASFVCKGTQTAMEETFGSTCHGAGRVMSRAQALKRAKGRSIGRELAQAGIVVRSKGRRTLDEEMPEAYKDVERVVGVMDRAGISPRVARLRPSGSGEGLRPDSVADPRVSRQAVPADAPPPPLAGGRPRSQEDTHTA